jgi:hypothetical protein
MPLSLGAGQGFARCYLLLVLSWESLLVHSVTATSAADPQVNDTTPIYSGCDVAEYYSDLLPVDWNNTSCAVVDNVLGTTSTWSREALETLLTGTHRNVLPYSSSTRHDVWDGLADVDAGNASGTVLLIYSQQLVSSTLYGTADTWNREDVFVCMHAFPVFESMQD